MSALVNAVEDYLALRRSLGFKLYRIDQLLLDFVAELEARGLETVTTEAALAWATKPAGADPYWHAKRLGCVRRFAVYLNALDPRCEVPPPLLAERSRRATPHLYSEEEVRALMEEARELAPRLRGASYEALIGLLSVTGMRPGEAVRLQRSDVDLGTGVVRVNKSKNVSRELPLHHSAVQALRSYSELRDELCPKPAGGAFFLSAAGTAIARETFTATFARLRRGAGLAPPPGSGRVPPRLHDFRHAFALRCLLGWYRCGADVATQLPKLSTYLGHRDPAATYWYLTATPELLALAARRLQGGQGARP
jgi:integrase/recombinase XerD